MAEDEGIFVPRRLIFIMIFASLFINVFFLLMGILIGKDDLKWQKEKTLVPATVDQVTAPAGQETATTDQLDQDLSVFEGETEEVRQDPVGASYLDSPEASTAPVQQEAEPPPVTSKPEPRSEPPQPRGDFWVQLSATADIQAARKFQKEVAGKGYAAIIVTEGAFHKVRVGPYTQREAADKAKDRVSREFNIKAWVVKK